MTTTRRSFLERTLLAGGAIGLGGATLLDRLAGAQNAGAAPRPRRALRILILGGTGFTGPHQVRYAVARGHTVTVFNRGRRQAELPAGVEHLQGDRNTGDLKALDGRTWDVVIDNPTTLPFWVRDAGRVLQNATQHYIFISTISVYPDYSRIGMDETSALAEYRGDDPLTETAETLRGRANLYGPLKVASEREAERWFPGKTTVIRPGLIVGPGDESGRFTYWPVRIDRGGEVLAPNSPADPVQFIDARDLAEWTIRMAETRSTGIYNATGPATPMPIGDMLNGIRDAIGSSATFTWVPAAFLEQHEVRGWIQLPVWSAPRPQMAGFSRIGIARALDRGLTFRPLGETARATLTWFKSQPADRQQQLLGGSLRPEKETEVLTAWRAASARRAPDAAERTAGARLS
jgi:2'-hydroxyisoflavone reductase